MTQNLAQSPRGVNLSFPSLFQAQSLELRSIVSEFETARAAQTGFLDELNRVTNALANPDSGPITVQGVEIDPSSPSGPIALSAVLPVLNSLTSLVQQVFGLTRSLEATAAQGARS